MANIPLAAYGIGPNAAVALSAPQAVNARNVAQAIQAPEIATAVISPAPIERIQLPIASSISAGASADSLVWSPPFPIDVISVEAGAAAAAGATGTVDVQILPLGGSYATILSAPIDVKTTAGTFVTGTVVDTDDRYKLETTGKIKAIAASGSGGALTGATVIIYFRRRAAAVPT